MTCPSGKIPYPSPQAAHAVLQHRDQRHRGKRSHRRRRTGGSAYQCPSCASWHLTSMPRR